MKNNIFDKIYKHYSWIIVGLGLVGFFLYQVMTFEGGLGSIVRDFKTYVMIAYTIGLNLVVISNAVDKSLADSFDSESYKTSEQINDIIIKDIRNNRDDFYNYIKSLNAHEKRITQEDYLMSKGKLVDDLTAKELKEFNKLKPRFYNVSGFTLPIFFEEKRNKEVSYNDATVSTGSFKKKGFFKKSLNGILLGAMSISITFSFQRVGDAFIQVGIIGAGLIMSYINYYARPKHFLTNVIPNMIKSKYTLYLSFKDYQKGKLELKEELVVEKVEEVVKEEVVEVIKEEVIEPEKERKYFSDTASILLKGN